MKKKISLLLGIIMLFSLGLMACSNDDSTDPVESEEIEENNVETETSALDDIIEKGTIVLGTSADYPPFEFHTIIDGKDEIVGFDIEIAKYIANELGVELEIKDMDFDNLLGGLSTGMLDMVIASMNPDPDRDANFTDIYYDATHSILVAKDSEYEVTSIDDLAGKKVGVQIGTTQEDIAKESIVDGEIISLSKNPDIIMNLKTKKIDFAIMETPVANSFAAANDDIRVIDDLTLDTESGGVAIALKKGNDELTERINEILDKIKSEDLMGDWLIEADELSNQDL